MKYEHLVSYVASEMWAILPSKLSDILAALAYRASGATFSEAEIQARIGGRPDRQAVPASGDAVAVIPIHGTIAHRGGRMPMSSGGTSTEAIGVAFRAALADDRVGTILFDVDSPGGTVTGVAELADEIFAARGQKRMVSMVNGLAASAAYWLATQADEVVSIPSGESGSIGVFFAHEDVSKALADNGVSITLLKAGKYKAEINPFTPLTDEAREFVQARVDAAYGQFVSAVARGRGVSAADVRNGFGEGRVLVAKDAKSAGMIDRIASPEATVARLVGKRGHVQAEVATPASLANTDRLRGLERF